MAVERLDLEQIEPTDILVNEHWLRYQFVAGFIKNKNILDIACGSGYGSNYLASQGAVKVTGADIDHETVAQVKQKYQRDNLNFRQASALDLPFKDDEFEAVVSLETIEHFTAEDQTKFLQELKRVLEPGGLLIMSTPNSEFSSHGNPYHLKELNYAELNDTIKKHFANCKIFKQGSAIATFIDAGQDKKFDITSDFMPRYFVTLSSDGNLPEVNKSFSSLNPLTLSMRENHPVMKLVGNVYYQLNKVKLFKTIFNYLSKKTSKN